MAKQIAIILVCLTTVLFCSAFVYVDNYYWFEEIKRQIPEEITISFFIRFLEQTRGLYYIDYPTEKEEEELDYILTFGYRMVDRQAMYRLYIFKKMAHR